MFRFDAPGVTLTSYPGERAKVVGRIYISDTADNVTVSDLDLAMQSNEYPGTTCTSSCGNASFPIAGSGVIVSGNDITNDNSDNCVHPINNGYGQADNLTVTGNRFHNCGEIPSNTAHSIYVSASSGATISNNVIYDSSAFGVKLGPRATNAIVSHNVLDMNGVGILVGDQDPCPSSTDASHDDLMSSNVITRSQVRSNLEGYWVTSAQVPGCFDIGTNTRGNVASGNCFYADNPTSGATGTYNVNAGFTTRSPLEPTSGGFYDDGTNFTSIPSKQSSLPPIYSDATNRNYHLRSASGSNNDCLEASGITDAAATANSRWQAPTVLSNSASSGQDYSDSDVAIGNDGTSAAAWIHNDGSKLRVEAIVREPGGQTGPKNWNYANPSGSKPAVTTLSASGVDASNPQVAVGGTGSNRVAVVTWVIWNGSTYIVQASVWSGGSWSSVVDLTPSTKWADYPSVSVGRDGTAVVAWQYTSDYAAARVRPPGASTSFGTESALSASGHNISDLSVGSTADGKAVATWLYNNGTNDVVRASNFNGTSWSAAVTVSATGQNAAEPSVAISPTSSGATAVATWRRYNGTNWIVQAAVRSTAGTWGSPSSLSATGANADTPSVGVASDASTDGKAVVLWRRWTGSEYVTQSSVRPAGGSFGTATTLSATGYDAVSPEVAVGGDGSALAVWHRWDTDAQYNRVQARSLPAGGSWSGTSTISSFATGANAWHPAVAVGSTQTAAAVWVQWNGTVYRVLTSNFYF